MDRHSEDCVTDKTRPFRVLSLDGGGMRGTYAATYLMRLVEAFSVRRKVEDLDLGRAFDLIVGTSTGAILACALAVGVPLKTVVEFYRRRGPAVFPRPLPRTLPRFLLSGDWFLRRRALRAGTASLREALGEVFRATTIAEVHRQRQIALAITAVDISRHQGWVFKTPHIPGSNGRDNHYQLVDVCLASTAAPVYRSLAAIAHPDGGHSGFNVFVDGGVWANNPVIVALVEALNMAPPDRPIEVFCLGTCPGPAGEQIAASAVHRNLQDWDFGGAAAALSIDAQEFAYDDVARLLAPHFNRKCTILRFPRGQVSAALVPYLNLDDTRPEAINALINQARSDAAMTNSRCNSPHDPDGRLICDLFTSAPPRSILEDQPPSNLPGAGLSTVASEEVENV